MAESPFQPHQKSILIVEDNTYLRQLLQTSLSRVGYNIVTSADGRNIPELIQKANIDLVLLDLILPETSGKIIVEDIRKASEIPIVVLSAFADPDCLVECLTLGADEFIAKPFKFNILMARIEALLRRIHWNEAESHEMQKRAKVLIELDNTNSEVVIEGRRERLTPQEYRFLQYFVSHPDSVVSAETLMQEVWETDCLSDTLISSMVRRLRSKIESEPSEPQLLQTVWGRGYRLCTVAA